MSDDPACEEGLVAVRTIDLNNLHVRAIAALCCSRLPPDLEVITSMFGEASLDSREGGRNHLKERVVTVVGSNRLYLDGSVDHLEDLTEGALRILVPNVHGRLFSE